MRLRVALVAGVFAALAVLGLAARARALRDRRGRFATARLKIGVRSDRRCRRSVAASIDALSRPAGWTITSSGLRAPLRPGEQRTATISLTPSRASRSHAVDLPIAVSADTLGVPSPHPTSAAGGAGASAIAGGFDLLYRLLVPGKPIPQFVLPPRPRMPPPVAYPSPCRPVALRCCASGRRRLPAISCSVGRRSPSRVGGADRSIVCLRGVMGASSEQPVRRVCPRPLDPIFSIEFIDYGSPQSRYRRHQR